jgi:nicotinic acid mononucleotide adenylyltransferase
VLAALGRADRVELFTIPAVSTSSSEIRERVRCGEPIDDLVPPAVAQAIAAAGLYRE